MSFFLVSQYSFIGAAKIILNFIIINLIKYLVNFIVVEFIGNAFANSSIFMDNFMYELAYFCQMSDL